MDVQYTLHKTNLEFQLIICGPLNTQDIESLKKEIEYQLPQDQAVLEVDLSSLRVIDSATLAFFAWLHQRFDARDQLVQFVGVPHHILRIFDTVGFLTHSRAFSFVEISVEESEEMRPRRLEFCGSLEDRSLVKTDQREFYPAKLELTQMRTFLDEFLDATTLTRSQRDDIRIAVGETFANAITHGARGVAHPYVRVDLRLYPHEFVAEVYDNGVNFAGDFEPPSDMFRVHGRGILLMRELADSVEFITDVDDPLNQGTTVRLVKRLD